MRQRSAGWSLADLNGVEVTGKVDEEDAGYAHTDHCPGWDLQCGLVLCIEVTDETSSGLETGALLLLRHGKRGLGLGCK